MKRILIVDDDLDEIIFFKRVLNDNRFYVDTYNDPQEALAGFKPHLYDLVFIDIRMPVLNGFELFKQLRKKDHKVRICFITAFESYYNSLKEEHPMLNARCFIRKPIDTENLLAIVKRELEMID